MKEKSKYLVSLYFGTLLACLFFTYLSLNVSASDNVFLIIVWIITTILHLSTFGTLVFLLFSKNKNN